MLNIGVAHAIAHRYRNRSIPVEDLEQVACMALDPGRPEVRRLPGPRLPDLRRARPSPARSSATSATTAGRSGRPRRVQEIQSKVINAYHHGEESGVAAVAGQAGRRARPAGDRRGRGAAGRGVLHPRLARRPGVRGRPRRDRPAHRRGETDSQRHGGPADAEPRAAPAQPAGPARSCGCASSRTRPSRRSATSSGSPRCRPPASSSGSSRRSATSSAPTRCPPDSPA